MINVFYSVFFVAISLIAGHGIYALINGLPASLYGMIIFTLLLHFRLCRADKVQQSIRWGIQHMGVCFIPAGVGIINHYSLLKQHGILLVAIIFFTTYLLLTLVGICFQQFENNARAKH
ncbi:CidA/LrgA family protein [Thalassotalea insulae]|uniref:CidA/LrgA family protein n=1 Tax=Thalassotalea insulae TaxID=2056778 RepID=A0ABQ6GTU7_9GAMM|nr:CidA/LrgA family protein [Thalassotalea insulae]GLX79368.1 CidA/LrgA family protein [Thalassotalea insulae]